MILEIKIEDLALIKKNILTIFMKYMYAEVADAVVYSLHYLINEPKTSVSKTLHRD